MAAIIGLFIYCIRCHAACENAFLIRVLTSISIRRRRRQKKIIGRKLKSRVIEPREMLEWEKIVSSRINSKVIPKAELMAEEAKSAALAAAMTKMRGWGKNINRPL